jgi:DNA-binding transcriptional MerR regulator
MVKRKFAIREICDLLGVKQHVLRYWEKEIPLLSPKKGISGHREYSWADLEMLIRIRHLLYERGYTIAGARQRLWEETRAEYQDAKALISALRAELVGLAESVHASHRRLDNRHHRRNGGNDGNGGNGG